MSQNTSVLDIVERIAHAVPFFALVLSIFAFILAQSAARRSGQRQLEQDIFHLRERLVSKEIRQARRTVKSSPAIIREARSDYLPSACDKAYLDKPHVIEKLNIGGARDLDEFTDAYAKIISVVANMVAIMPRRRRGSLARLWRKETADLYGQMQGVLGATDEARWELNKEMFLWPLNREMLSRDELNLLHDESIVRQLDRLNANRRKRSTKRRKKTVELKLPHYPLSDHHLEVDQE